ncbi:MAG: 1,4-alpha-glucan branching protein domain-containing protein [Methylocystaceae bacterium]
MSRLYLVLHSHIPFVKGKGRWPFGEVWLYEAMAETYIPLLTALGQMADSGLKPLVTFSFTPPLLRQLQDPYIQENFLSYLREKEAIATADYRRFRAQGHREMAALAEYYANFYRQIQRQYEFEYERNLIGYINKLRQQGIIEVLATAATHAYLPLIRDEQSLRLQIDMGLQTYQQCFGEAPRGFWLPECGYTESLDRILAERGISYFFVDSHGLEGGRPRGVSSYPQGQVEVEETFAARTGLTTYQVYRAEGSPTVVFGRNALLSYQVWSHEYGYPGDPMYREFHRSAEIGGLKYWRVTDRQSHWGNKDLYDPVAARKVALKHASHFVRVLNDTAAEAVKLGFDEPVLVACYDTELFGHWWWEGVTWLEELLRLLQRGNCQLSLPSEQVGQLAELPSARVLESSWGMGGKHWGWYNEETEWMWDTIKDAIAQVNHIPDQDTESIVAESRSQAWHELLLMQSSDWFFMVTNNHTRDYAVSRFLDHYARLTRICDTVQSRGYNLDYRQWLQQVAAEDSLFNNLL